MEETRKQAINVRRAAQGHVSYINCYVWSNQTNQLLSSSRSISRICVRDIPRWRGSPIRREPAPAGRKPLRCRSRVGGRWWDIWYFSAQHHTTTRLYCHRHPQLSEEDIQAGTLTNVLHQYHMTLKKNTYFYNLHLQQFYDFFFHFNSTFLHGNEQWQMTISILFSTLIQMKNLLR